MTGEQRIDLDRMATEVHNPRSANLDGLSTLDLNAGSGNITLAAGGTITDGVGSGFLQGPENQWIDQLSWLHHTHRIDTFILWPRGDVVDQTHRFATIADRMR